MTMEAGIPLKEILGPRAIDLLAESFAAVTPGFSRTRFRKNARQGLEVLGIMQRGAHLARALATELPADFSRAAPILIAALGPPLASTAQNGLAVFFYLPHSSYVAEFGSRDFANGMRANYEITQRFTAEFCIRPFLENFQMRSLRLLRKWAQDQSPHVRRLVSEGTRPRLPWASRLPEFQKDPRLALPLLEVLRDDQELYVRRSVANHLGDIAKDHLDFTLDVCEQWLRELDETKLSDEQTSARRWLIRHAVRLPAKKGNRRALALRREAGGTGRN